MTDYVQLEVKTTDKLLVGLVDCYRKVFALPPWNEWKKCQECGKKFGLDLDPHLFESGHCNKPIIDFWPEGVVAKDILLAMEKGSLPWLALDNKRVIGFCWGHPVTLEEAEERRAFPGLACKMRDIFGNSLELVGYQTDIGVLDTYRGKKIGKELFSRRIKYFLNKGIEVGILRTTKKTVVYSWYIRMGYKVVGDYNDSEEQVILAGRFADLSL